MGQWAFKKSKNDKAKDENIKDVDNEEPNENGYNIVQSGAKKAKLPKRNYNSNFLKIGFTWNGDCQDPRPQCVICFQTFTSKYEGFKAATAL